MIAAAEAEGVTISHALTTHHHWDHAGELRRRHELAPWRWTAGYYVLCDGLLYEFSGSSLAARLKHARAVSDRCAAWVLTVAAVSCHSTSRLRTADE